MLTPTGTRRGKDLDPATPGASSRSSGKWGVGARSSAMGTLRGDNGGERPQEGGGVPGLPPEWGTVIIPDDPGALDREGARLRRRFRREAFRRRWRRRFHLRPRPMGRATDDSPGLAVPLLIMAVAIIATLTSLFAIAWPARRPTTTPKLPIRT